MIQFENKRIERRKVSQKTVLLNTVEVYFGEIYVGYGLAYYDGRYMLKPDIVSLTGQTLPEAMYMLRFSNDPQLAILARGIH